MLEDLKGEAPPNVRRVFFREVLDGDRRKAEARSNDADTGGGARDFRFNAKNFDAFLKKVFTIPVEKTRDGKELDVRTATVHAKVDGKPVAGPLEYWPPTDARPSEGRIGRISSHPAFQTVPGEDPTFALFTQLDDGTVHGRYATMTEIQQGNATIAKHIAACYTNTRSGRAAIGYLDFDTGKAYCHA